MKNKRLWLVMIIFLLVLPPNGEYSLAQEGKTAEKKISPGQFKVPTDGTFKVLASRYMSRKVVKGAPYSATAITEHTQTLGDGNQIIRKNESAIYRDGEGRIRLDQTLGTIGKWAAAGEPQRVTHISDPVAGHSYNLDHSTRTARKGEAFKKKLDLPKLKEDKQKEKPSKSANDPALKSQIGGARKEISSPDGRKKIESLGKQTIEGVEVEGRRSTLVLPAGEIGNTLPIEIVDESWYSHELQVMVMTRLRDPRIGETTWRLTNIKRGEPDRSLFEVPAGYTILDQPARKKMAPGKKSEK